MDHVCVALPVLRGRTVDARLLEVLERHRKAGYAVSEERIGISKEPCVLATVVEADLLIGYIEAADFARAAELFAASRDPVDT